jgi:uncharacterized protein
MAFVYPGSAGTSRVTFMKVVVLGASPDKERFANKAQVQLMAAGHEVVPVHPEHDAIEGIPVVKDLKNIRQPVDTVTVYIGPKRIGPLIADIVALKPRRVILNPGAESPELSKALKAAGISHLEACTLIMLGNGDF